MDALKFIEERNRICERYWQVDGDCDGCPMVNVDECNELRNMVDDAGKAVGKVVEIVEKWSKEHPRKTKTRQDVFLSVYPNAKMDKRSRTVDVSPCFVDKSWSANGCPNNDCAVCRRQFWMQEVE